MHYTTLLYMSAKSITSISITMEANHTRNTHTHTRAHARTHARTHAHTHIIYDTLVLMLLLLCL